MQCCTWEHTGREAQRQILDKLILVCLSILFDKLGYLMTVVFEHTVMVFFTFSYTFISSNAALLWCHSVLTGPDDPLRRLQKAQVP